LRGSYRAVQKDTQPRQKWACLSVLPTTPADLYVRACRSVRVNSDG
jgi:hypothetical protein